MAARGLILPLALAGCAPLPAPTPAAYRAIGQEPGWTLMVADGRMTYLGDYGETRIEASAPAPRAMIGGRRYETPRLTVDVIQGRCNDVMSGAGYADQVTVIADGRTVRGCGGQRRPDWDS